MGVFDGGKPKESTVPGWRDNLGKKGMIQQKEDSKNINFEEGGGIRVIAMLST